MYPYTRGSNGLDANLPPWATFEKPNQYSEGFRYVVVNGVLVIDDGKLTGKAPGVPLRGPGYRRD